MVTDWLKCTVADIASKGRNAIVGGPFGSELVSSDYVPTGVPVIRGANMGNRWVGGDFVFVSREKSENLAANHAEAGDIVVTQRGTLGQVALVPEGPYERYLISQSQMKLTVDSAKASPLFIYYLFRSPSQQNYIRSNAIQTGVPHTNLGLLKSTPILLPPLAAQHSIARLLGSLDDKIELNRKMNETLEAMARALFKSWFVDFDPVRAKAAGRSPAGMDAETAKLFPSEFVDSPLGPIPKGWKVRTLGDITDKIGSGATPRGGDKAYVSNGINFVRSQNVYDSEFIWDGLVQIDEKEATRLSGVTVKLGDVLLNITGASILRTCIIEPMVLPARVNQHVAIVRPKPPVPSSYIHNHLLQPATKAFLMGLDAGASRQAVTKTHIQSVPLPLPHEALLSAWVDRTQPLYQRITTLRVETRTLTELRDVLLPRLLSGEIQVQGANQNVLATAL
jgi:type I restriction enzyme S subunit